MYNRFQRPNDGDGKGVRRRAKRGQPKNARDDKERWFIAEEEHPMVSRPRQLQRHGRKGSRKLLLVPSLPARRQPRQIPDRNDECFPRHSRVGKTILLNGEGFRKTPSDTCELY